VVHALEDGREMETTLTLVALGIKLNVPACGGPPRKLEHEIRACQ
jgi:hypothetical protein